MNKDVFVYLAAVILALQSVTIFVLLGITEQLNRPQKTVIEKVCPPGDNMPTTIAPRASFHT